MAVRRGRSSSPSGGASSPAGGRLDLRRFLRNVLLWLLPVLAAWAVATPYYNRLLVTVAALPFKLIESPNITQLLPTDAHYIVVSRRDFPPARFNLYRIRVTDLHFPTVLLGAFFLAVPGVGFGRRLRNLGLASLISAAFHVLLLILWVQFVYATQLGSWSAEHYGPFAREAWGLAKHVLDLPVKLALPFALWAAFYLPRLLPARRGAS